MKKQWSRRIAALICAGLLCLTAGCSAGIPEETGQPQEAISTTPDATPQTTPTLEATSEEVAEVFGLTLEQLAEEHGSLVSTTDTAITKEQIKAIYQAVESVTLGNEKVWHLTVIPNLDLIQELLPTYTEAGLIHEGNVAIIISCSSETGNKEQYHMSDTTALISAGMVAQQICVAAQMQGIGFKVITDCIYESSYTLYKDNIVDEEHLLKPGMEWEDWVRQFAIPKESYYVMSQSGESIKTLSGEYVTLGGKDYTYYEADGVTPATKKKVEYVEGYMTPCAVVLLGNTEDAPQKNRIYSDNFATLWDGSYDPYPTNYGGSIQAAKPTESPEP